MVLPQNRRRTNRGFGDYLRLLQEAPIPVAPGTTTGYTPSTAGTNIAVDPAVAQMVDPGLGTGPLPPGGGMPLPAGGGGVPSGVTPQGIIDTLRGPFQGGPPRVPVNIEQNLPPSSMNEGMTQGQWGTGGQDQALGQYASPTMANVVPTYQDALMSDPEAYYRQFARANGMELGGGEYALGLPYAQNMPYEYMMTEAGQNPMFSGDDYTQFMDQNIQAGQTIGSGYYTADQYLQEVGTQGSQLNTFIFNTIDPETQQLLTPAQQMSNLLASMEAILGGSMSDEGMAAVSNRYYSAYMAYMDAVTAPAPGQQPYGGTLEQWLKEQGLLP